METISAALAVLAGVFIRLALPIGGTVLLVALFRRLDARWQKEAELLSTQPWDQARCWEIKNCPPEQREACAAANSDRPCWQERRLNNGYLREECLECEVFQQAPIPSHS